MFGLAKKIESKKRKYKYAKKIPISPLFLIFQNIDFIRLLNDSFPQNFFYMDDVIKFAEKSEGPGFITNNYKGSFIEQEICFSKLLTLLLEWY